MKNRFLSLLKFFIGWPISLVAIIFILKIILPQSQSVLPHLKDINIALLIYGIICFFIYYILRCAKWQLLLKAKNYHLPFRETAFLWEASELNRYIPGNIWAFVGRMARFHGKQVDKKDIATFLVYEVVYVGLSCGIVSLLSIPLLFMFFPQIINQFTVSIFILFVLGGIAIYLFHKKIFAIFHYQPPQFITYIFPPFSITTQLKILFVMTLALFFFGLGHYFVISSFIYLSPQDIFAYVGFFVFSLFIGFFSIITPAGLGIREAVTTLGLAKAIPVGLAGFAALYARGILIITEILFFICTAIWYKQKNTIIDKLENHVLNYTYETILAISAFIYFLYFNTVSALRYDNFYAGRFDLGNMAQTVWNTMHGRIFQFTDPNGTDNISRLAFHADFILVLLTPFYFFWQNPKMLLLIQTLVIAAGSIFVYLLAKNVLKNKPIALVFALLYLLNPSVQRTSIYDFHPVSLCTTFLLGAFYFLQTKQYKLFFTFAFLAALTKEHVWIIIALFGGYIVLQTNKKLLGSLIFISSLSIFYFLVSYAIPHALGSQHFALAYYSDFGDKPSSIIKNVFLSPTKTLSTITTQEKLYYFKELFMPLGYLSLLSPLYLIFALPDFMINLLSNNTNTYQIYYQYTAAITPFLFIAGIYGVKKFRLIFPKISYNIFIIYLCIFGLISAHLFGPLPGSTESNLDMITKPVTYNKDVEKILFAIPKNSSVAASNNLGSHLSNRQKIYTIPFGIDKADFIAFLLNDPNALPPIAQQKNMINQLKKDRRYIIAFEENDFILFQKIF